MEKVKLTECVLTFDTGGAVLRPLITREQFGPGGVTTDVLGLFTYQDEIRLTPARRRALIALLRSPLKGL